MPRVVEQLMYDHYATLVVVLMLPGQGMYPRRSWAQRTNAMENLRERKKWSYFKTPPAVAHHGPVHVHR